MARKNGGIIGPANIPTGNFGSAPGVWSLAEVKKYIEEGIWPVATSGFQVQNSLRFDDGSSDYLSKTFSSAGNRKTWTWSGWVKKTNIGTGFLFSSNTGDPRFTLFFNSDDIRTFDYDGGYNFHLRTDSKFRDVSAWYHVVLAVDTTQATASNRVKLYVNGVQETSFSTEVYPSQNSDTAVNNSVVHEIGREASTSANYLDGYLSEVVFIDGQALDETSFGETDATTGNWVAKDVSGLTFGNNGFYLPFQNASALGQDDSGNDNDFTVNNLTSIDQCIDSPTNNFATLNPLQTDPSGNTAFSQGNNTFQATANDWVGTASTLGVSSGKYYAEFRLSALTTSSQIGIATGDYLSDRGVTDYIGFTSGLSGFAYGKYLTSAVDANEGKIQDQTGTFNSYGSNTGASTGNIVGVALDLDNNKAYWSINGTWENSADPGAGTNGFSIGAGSYHFGVWGYNSTQQSNFGNPPFTISSGNTDFSALGNFEYEVPSGYRALCTKNIGLIG